MLCFIGSSHLPPNWPHEPPGPRQSVGIFRLHKHVPGTASPLYSLPETQAHSSTVLLSSAVFFPPLHGTWKPSYTQTSLILLNSQLLRLYSTLAALGNDRTAHILLPASLHISRRRSDFIRITYEGLVCSA
ncbi:hypothetical protein GGI43DRAFT_7105 [Trichoderma evansii]